MHNKVYIAYTSGYALYPKRCKILETHKIIFFLIMALHMTPIVSRLYKLLENKTIFVIYLILSAILFCITFFISSTNIDPKINSFYSVLTTPFLFIILYKTFDIFCLKTLNRHIYMTNHYTKSNKKLKVIDYLVFFVMFIVPILAPILFVQNIL